MSESDDCACPFHWAGGHGAMPFEPVFDRVREGAMLETLAGFGFDPDTASRVVDLDREESAGVPFEVGPASLEVARVWREAGSAE